MESRAPQTMGWISARQSDVQDADDLADPGGRAE
jgi:hypothetical protein